MKSMNLCPQKAILSQKQFGNEHDQYSDKRCRHGRFEGTTRDIVWPAGR
jgi:hypothetical protein